MKASNDYMSSAMVSFWIPLITFYFVPGQRNSKLPSIEHVQMYVITTSILHRRHVMVTR